MIEAKITCLTGTIQLPDLSMSMTKGMVIYMPEAKARSSKDLERAWKGRGVSVQYVTRVQERRNPPKNKPNPVFPVPPGMAFAPPTQEAGEQVIFDPDIIAERVVTAINEDALTTNKIRLAVSKRLDQFEERLVGRVVAVLKEEIAAGITVQGVPQAMAVQTPNQPVGKMPLVEEDVPVFIPSKIRSDDMKAEIAIESQQGDSSGLSDAAAALRAARAGKKRRTETD